MNILLIGSGGREHALAWKIVQSKLCSKLFIAPGNAGTGSCGENVALDINEFEAVKVFCLEQNIQMVIVGPEDPLVNGIVDFFREDSSLSAINIIGPSQEGALLEGSKSYAKAFMRKYNIPTASYEEFTKDNIAEGRKYIAGHSLPIVLKADGLAAGKGVVICEDTATALVEFDAMIMDRKFGEASARVVVEQFLSGIELSVFALTDGKDFLLLPEAKDYKRVGEGDTGSNTGGMGAISPVPFADELFMEKVRMQVIEPTIKGIEQEEMDYKGFVFFGMIKVNEEPFVIEYNCRMGDPETEVVIPRINNDLVEVLDEMGKGNLNRIKIDINEKAAATIIAVSGGYPGDYQKGLSIRGLEDPVEKSLVFHSGTTIQDEKLLTNGGRVLAITSFGENIKEAVATSLNTLEAISFDGMNYRKDIGFEF